MLSYAGFEKAYPACSTDMRKSIDGLAAIVQQGFALKKDILHADETTLQVLRDSGEVINSTSYMWLYRTGRDGPPIILYDCQTSRASKHPARFLNEFKGYLHVDGYAGYDGLSNIRLVGCWAHARRKFDEP